MALFLLACVTGSGAPGSDSPERCDAATTADTQLDPWFSGSYMASGNVDLQWASSEDGVFLRLDLGADVDTSIAGPLSAALDASGRTTIGRRCSGPDSADSYVWDDEAADAGSVSLVGTLAPYTGNMGEEVCCAGSVTVEFVDVRFADGATLVHTDLSAFLSTEQPMD